jgi:hypothetical protein
VYHQLPKKPIQEALSSKQARRRSFDTAVYHASSPYNKAAERDAWSSFLDILKKAYGEEEARDTLT